MSKHEIQRAMERLDQDIPDPSLASQALSLLSGLLKGRGAPPQAPPQGDEQDPEQQDGPPQGDEGQPEGPPQGDEGQPEGPPPNPACKECMASGRACPSCLAALEAQAQQGGAPGGPPAGGPPAGGPPAMMGKSKAAVEAVTDDLHKSWLQADETGQVAEVIDASDALEFLANQIGTSMGEQTVVTSQFAKSQAVANDLVAQALHAVLEEVAGLREEMALFKSQVTNTPASVPASGQAIIAGGLVKSRKAAEPGVSTLTKSQVGAAIVRAINSGDYEAEKATLLNNMSGLDVKGVSPDDIAKRLPAGIRLILGL